MADGTKLGSVYLDLEMSMDIDQQIDTLMQKTQSKLSHFFNGFNFSGVFKKVDKEIESTSKVFNKLSNNADKTSQKIESSLDKALSGISEKVDQSLMNASDKELNLSLKIGEKENDIDELKTKIENIKTLITASESEALVKEEELNQKASRIESLKAKIAELQSLVKTNPLKKWDLEIDIETHQQEIEKLVNESDKLGKELFKLDNMKLSKLKAEHQSLSNRLKEATQQLDVFMAKYQKAKNLNKESKPDPMPQPPRSPESAEKPLNGPKRSLRLVKSQGRSLLNINGIARTFMRNLLGITFLLRMVYKLSQSFFRSLSESLSTNSQFNNSLNQIKSNLATAFAPIYHAILPAINALMSAIATVTAYIAGFVAAIFGKTAKQANTQAKALQNAKKGMQGYGAAAEEASGQLASFDQLNDITEQSGGGGGGGGAPEIVDVNVDQAQIDGMMDKIKGAFGGLTAWMGDKFGGIWQTFLQRATINLTRTQAIAQKIWRDIQTLGTPLAKWFNDDVVPLAQSVVSALLTIFNDLWEVLNQIFSDLWELAIFPFVQNMITVVLPVLTQWLTEIVGSFMELWNVFIQLFSTIWTDVFAPGIAFATQVWNDFTTDIAAIWEEHGKPYFEELNKAIQGIGEILLRVWEEYLKPIWEYFAEIVQELWNETIRPFVQSFMEGMAKIGRALLEFWNNVVKPFIDWFLTYFKPIWDVIWRWIQEKVDIVVNTLKGIIEGLKQTFQGIVDFLTGVFTGNWEQAWDGVVGIFSGIWETIKTIISGAWEFILGLFSDGGQIFMGVVEGIAGVFTTIVNALIDGINSLIKIPFDTINGILNWIKEFSILGMQPFMGLWGYDPLPIPQIPQLAKGGVLTAPQLVMAGEYSGARSNPEIVTPQNIMAETFEKVLNQVNQQGGESTIHLVVNLDGRVIYETVVDQAKLKQRQLGKEVLAL